MGAVLNAANGTLAGTPGAIDPPQVTSFGRKLLMKDVSHPSAPLMVLGLQLAHCWTRC